MRADVWVFGEETGKEGFLGLIGGDYSDIVTVKILWIEKQGVKSRLFLRTKDKKLTGFCTNRSSMILQMIYPSVQLTLLFLIIASGPWWSIKINEGL